MIISKRFKLDQAVSDDQLRPGMVHVSISKHHAVASDGHILAVVPSKLDEGDTVGLVPAKAFKEARREKSKFEYVTMKVNGSVILSNGLTLDRPDAQFPNVAPLVRTARTNNTFRVCLDVSLLSSLSDALGTDKVELSFDNDKKAIFVRPLDSSAAYDEGFGLLMPIRGPKTEK